MQIILTRYVYALHDKSDELRSDLFDVCILWLSWSRRGVTPPSVDQLGWWHIVMRLAGSIVTLLY